MRVLLTALLLLGVTPAASPLGGGSLLSNGGYRCTAAFAATQGAIRHLIAGPGCGSTGAQMFSGNNVAVGPIISTPASGGAAVVRVTNTAAWTVVPWISVGSTRHVIRGATETPVGGAVCLLDRSVGQRCGVITAKNQTINLPEGTIYGVTKTTICMPPTTAVAFVSGDQAQGVPLAGGYSCTTAGVSYFLPIRPILAAHGLTLLSG